MINQTQLRFLPSSKENALVLFITIIGPTVGIILLNFGIIPVRSSPVVLLIIFILVLVRIFQKKWSWEDLGCTRKYFAKGLPYYGIFISIGLVCFFLAEHFMPVRKDIFSAKAFGKIFVFAALFSFLQEFVLRSYLILEGQRILSRKANIIANAVLFTLIHIFFSNLESVLPSCLLYGLVIAIIYDSFPNLFLAGIVHTVFNILAMYVCIFNPF